jgi:hypothetical protein
MVAATVVATAIAIVRRGKLTGFHPLRQQEILMFD